MENSRIIIEGETVRRVRETIEEISSTDEFLKQLSVLRPATFSVPKGTVAISVSDETRTYYIGMPPRIARSEHILYKSRHFDIFLPTSLFAIKMSKANTVLDMHWHILMGHFQDKEIKDIDVVANFMPNVNGINGCCVGQARIKHNPKSPLLHTINRAIASILDSTYNHDLLFEETMNPKFCSDMVHWATKDGIEEAEKSLVSCAKAFVTLESRNYETMRKDARAKAQLTRMELLQQRRNALEQIEKLKGEVTWFDQLFPYLERWTEKHMAAIEADPFAASDLLIEEASAVQKGVIKDDGSFFREGAENE